MTSTTTAPVTKDPRTTKKFAKILALLDGNELAAVKAWNDSHPDRQIAVEEAPPAALTAEEQVQVLIAKQGMTFTRGRIYSRVSLVEAQVRVLKTGKPEVVRTSDDKHVKAVAIWPTAEADVVVCQNLTIPS